MAGNTRNGRTRSNSNDTGGNGRWGEQYKFVDRRILASEKDDFRKWALAHKDDLLTLLSDVATSEHKVSVTYQPNGDAFIVSFTCNDERSTNYHCIMTSRSDDLGEAIELNLFKVYVLFEGRSWASEDMSKNWG